MCVPGRKGERNWVGEELGGGGIGWGRNWVGEELGGGGGGGTCVYTYIANYVITRILRKTYSAHTTIV